MNAVVYARFSSHNQQEQSIDGQLRVCGEYCEKLGYNIVNTYIDRAMTGTNDQRPAFQQMIKDSSKSQFDLVIVYKLDRFARNRYDSAIYKKQLRNNGVKVISATEGIGEGNESLILEAVLEAMAENYSRQLSQNVKRGLKESALNCNSTGGHIPLGYKIVDKKLVIDEDTVFIPKFVFEEYAKGTSKRKIADELNNRGYRTRRGMLFCINSFNNIISNKKYIGTYHYNGIEIENGCPAIIDKETFEICEKRKKANKRTPGKHKAKVNYELTGKAFCGMCGAPLVGESAKSKQGIYHYYYVCAHRKKKPDTCKKMREKKGFLEWYVVEQTCQYVLQPNRLDYIANKVCEEYNKQFDNNSRLEELKNLLKKQNKEFEKLTQTMISTTSPKMIEMINQKAEELETQITNTENEIAKEKLLAGTRLDPKEVTLWLQQFCSGDPLEEEYRKRIIDAFINSVYVYDDKIVIFFNVKGGKQVSYMEMLEETQDIFEELEKSSHINTLAQPNDIKCEPIIFFGSHWWGMIKKR